MADAVDMHAEMTFMNKNINVLLSEDKRKRRKALCDLRDYMLKNEESEPACAPDFCSRFEQIYKVLLRCFVDPSEACRELSVTLFLDLLHRIPVNEKHLIDIMPVLTQRLGSIELVETSEEVRYFLVDLLRNVIKKYGKALVCYFNDIVTILVQTIVDPYPKIKKESCDCTIDLAAAIPEHFHMQSESLVKPIIQNFTHQQYRVRVAAVFALGAIVHYGNNKSINDAAGPLAERLFDQAQQVREAVVQVLGDWLVSLPDRYSYFHKIIPLMLTCLNDESPNLQEKTWVLWDSAGQQWLKENEDDVKEKLDFLTVEPDYYPPNLKRPNLGCRMLVKRNLHKFAPGLVRELQDWLPDVRVRASQLLCTLIVNAETDIAQYVEQLLLGMYRACGDEDQRVVSNVERAAELMGYFVPAQNYWSLVQPVMEDCCHQGHLRILSSLMRCTPVSSLLPKLSSIAEMLQNNNICRSRELVYQIQLVKCCVNLMEVCGESSTSASQHIFNILVTVLGLAHSDHVTNNAQGALDMLLKLEGLNSTNDLYDKYMRPLLQDICTTPESWTVHCAERLIFQALLLQSGSALGKCLDIVVPSLAAALNPDNPDAEMKLKLMTSVAFVLQNRQGEHSIPLEYMDPFLFSVVEKVLTPNLTWRAGRTAEALRTITVSCLLAMLQAHTVIEKSTILFLLDPLIPILLTLIEDSARKTRLYTCCVVGRIIALAYDAKCLKAEHVHKIYFVILKRLDDVTDDVRRSAVAVLHYLFTHLPDDYSVESSSAHIEALFATMLVHLDDSDPEFRDIILGALKDISHLNSMLLMGRLTASQQNFRNQEACNSLIAHVSGLM